MMVMKHQGEKRCPYCFSRRLSVVDYGMADKSFHKRFGKFWFKLKCLRCEGTCQDITDLKSASEEKEIKIKRMEEATA